MSTPPAANPSAGPYDESLTVTAARMFFTKLHHDFPFADWDFDADPDGVPVSRSLAVQMAAMLSPFARGLVPASAPPLGFLYDANSQRSGKTLLLKMAVIPTNGALATQAWNKRDEELRKALDAEVLLARPYIAFDNVRGHIGSPVLEAFMTSTTWTGRVLGKTEMFTAENNAVVFLTGNDANLSTDMDFRVLKIKLFVEEANVQERAVRNPIDDAWLQDPANRLSILSHLWAIVRSWDAAGRPLATEHLRNGFETWCKVIGGMVQHAGFGDPLAPPDDETGGGNPEVDDMRSLVRELTREEGAKRLEFTFAELVDVLYEHSLLAWKLDGKEVTEEFGGAKRTSFKLTPGASVSLGRLLKQYAPVVAPGARFIRGRVFNIEGERWRMSATGKDRTRRYVLTREEVA